MKCVILAAGKGTRLRPLTDTTPKPLVKVAGVPLLDRIVQAIPDEVTEFIIVTGYMEEKIMSHCGDNFYGRPVTYVHQKDIKGTAYALWLCKDLLKGRFLFLFADDIHGADDIKRLISLERGIAVTVTDKPERFGIVTRDADNMMIDMEEKPSNPKSNLASTGLMVLDENIFKYKLPENFIGELYLTEIINKYNKDYPLTVLEQKIWLPVGYPEDIVKVENYLSKNNLL